MVSRRDLFLEASALSWAVGATVAASKKTGTGNNAHLVEDVMRRMFEMGPIGTQSDKYAKPDTPSLLLPVTNETAKGAFIFKTGIRIPSEYVKEMEAVLEKINHPAMYRDPGHTRMFMFDIDEHPGDKVLYFMGVMTSEFLEQIKKGCKLTEEVA